MKNRTVLRRAIKLQAMIAAIAVAFVCCGTATAAMKTIALHLTASRTNVAYRCTRNFPATWPVTVESVHVDGQNMQPTSTQSTRRVYYVGNNTLVLLVSHPGDGPVCANVATLARRVTVTVTLFVSTP